MSDPQSSFYVTGRKTRKGRRLTMGPCWKDTPHRNVARNRFYFCSDDTNAAVRHMNDLGLVEIKVHASRMTRQAT